jgi:hypothetical protein
LRLNKLMFGCCAAVLFFFTLAAGWAQAAQPSTPPASAAQDATPAVKPETLLTAAQEKELLGEIPKMLEFSSQDTGLAVHSQVKGRVTDRNAIEKFLAKKLKDDKDAKRLERSELVMKKFGLLDPSFQLRPFLISLLKEQIAGYYDDKTRTMNLLNWVDIDDQKPVMAHELTHALQDQRVHLKKWEESVPDESSPSKNFKQDQERVATDEVGSARDAVLEGQAMVPLIDLSLKSMGQSVKTAPQVIPLMVTQMAQTDPATSPIMAKAPLVLQESMLFSYAQGLSFIAAILAQKGQEQAFAGTLDSPPGTSAEILHPEQYLAHTKEPLLQIPDLHPLLDANYAPYDVGVVGEFDVETLADVFVGPEESKQITPMWAGGTYYAAQRRSDLQSSRKDTADSVALVYYSEWKSNDAAKQFAHIYESQFPRKYSHVEEMKPDATSTTTAPEDKQYRVDGGYALVSVTGNSVFISEGFTSDEARKLEGMFQGTSTRNAVYARNSHGLTQGLRGFIGESGTLRCTLPSLVNATSNARGQY